MSFEKETLALTNSHFVNVKFSISLIQYRFYMCMCCGLCVSVSEFLCMSVRLSVCLFNNSII